MEIRTSVLLISDLLVFFAFADAFSRDFFVASDLLTKEAERPTGRLIQEQNKWTNDFFVVSDLLNKEVERPTGGRMIQEQKDDEVKTQQVDQNKWTKG